MAVLAAVQSVVRVAGERSAPGVALDRVTVRYAGITALESVSLHVAHSEVLCLLGPSGSGKSTLLRVLAGLERPASGRVTIDGAEVAGDSTFVEPEERRIGLVFQDYALFPHLNVTANVAFGLHRRPAAEVRRIVDDLLARLDLTRYATTYPHALSGGERQRVALARAMAPQPRILLMDEPFSSLDGRLRDDVRHETMAFLRSTATTTVVVTHDPAEAMRIADRIGLLYKGRLMQCGRPDEVYARPSSLFAARLMSEINELPGTCRDGRLETALGWFDAPGLPAGARATACIRPEQLRVSLVPSGVRARVAESTFLGDADQLTVALDGHTSPLIVTVAGRAPVRAGDVVYVDVAHADVLVFPNP